MDSLIPDGTPEYLIEKVPAALDGVDGGEIDDPEIRKGDIRA